MRKTILHITCGLLLATGWANALAQGTTSPAQRLNLELVDNVSNYNIATQQNEYTNTLRLSQPTSDNKLTAGMLNNGDNLITVTRQGVKDGQNVGNPADVASINLSATITTPEFIENISEIDFSTYTSGSTITLTAPWSSSSLTRATYGTYSGKARIGSNGYIRYTVPAQYNGGYFDVYVNAAQTGSFRVNGTSYSINQAGQWNFLTTVGPLTTGSQITIQGPSGSNSPYMSGVALDWSPASYMPSIALTPTTTVNGETTVGTTATYTPNDNIALASVSIIDEFTAETSDNNHPDHYKYEADLDANISFVENSTQSSFLAAVDFSSNGTVYGPGAWGLLGDGTGIYNVGSSSEQILGGVIFKAGAMTYTLPNTFDGNQVNVTVSSCSGTYGAGTLIVNGESHTFTANSQYTWTINTGANGVIEFRCPDNQSFAVAISMVIITDPNTSLLNAPKGDGRKLESTKRSGIKSQGKQSATRSLKESSIQMKLND